MWRLPGSEPAIFSRVFSLHMRGAELRDYRFLPPGECEPLAPPVLLGSEPVAAALLLARRRCEGTSRMRPAFVLARVLKGYR
jgi:hypothetical protein